MDDGKDNGTGYIYFDWYNNENNNIIKIYVLYVLKR